MYTIRKNSLSRLLDPIPEVLQDQSVGTERLVETRKVCKVAWDHFATARNALVEAQPEDDDQNAELEERDREFGDLEVRKEGLMVALADAIATCSRNHDAQKHHLERQVDLKSPT